MAMSSKNNGGNEDLDNVWKFYSSGYHTWRWK